MCEVLVFPPQDERDGQQCSPCAGCSVESFPHRHRFSSGAWTRRFARGRLPVLAGRWTVVSPGRGAPAVAEPARSGLGPFGSLHDQPVGCPAPGLCVARRAGRDRLHSSTHACTDSHRDTYVVEAQQPCIPGSDGKFWAGGMQSGNPSSGPRGVRGRVTKLNLLN